jgi:nickel-dependent lactate racemase
MVDLGGYLEKTTASRRLRIQMALTLQPPGIATSAIRNSVERVRRMKKVNFIVNCVNDNALMFLGIWQN